MDHELFARRTGDGPQVVVLLHGFGGSHQVWTAVQDALSDRATVIAYDLPGHAGSLSWPGGGPVKVAVRAILDDLSRRQVQRVHLVGHSMGGAVATIVASSEPERVSSLTLLAPGGFGPEINHRLLARYAAARSEMEMRAALEGMFGFNSPLPEELVRGCHALRELPGQREKLIEIGGLICRDGKQGVIPREWLAGLAMPVAVVWGQLDGVLPAHQTNDLPPRFALHRVDGAGHMLIDEAPELVAEVIRRQLGPKS
ncbi:MAG TPA: alpha/beta fold hydrolase [Rhizobiaceae bacterium]|nr:alpha/beta fold hydrolase [Rhizobiaceae bacterium]